MALLNQSVQVAGQIGKFFETLREGQAPEKFTRELLKDLGYKSSNHLAFLPLLKGLGFLTADGSPTQRYRDFLDPTRWRSVLAEAVKEAYSDIFVIKSRPSKSDRKAITGKYKSTYNMSETAADRAAGTFLALLELADDKALYESPDQVKSTQHSPAPPENATSAPAPSAQPVPVGLHYNLQIHLPATKDVEVYNAIFKSMREHLID